MFNLIPSHAVCLLGIMGIGALPYGLRWLIDEKPRLKDEFEMFLELQKRLDATKPGYNPTAINVLESKWQAAHKDLGNLQ